MSETADIAPRPGDVLLLEPGLRRILAPNPGPMTHWGTNTYLLGEGQVAVIDPGPNLPAHLAAIKGALGHGERISHILVTHAHLDHSALARPLAQATGAPIFAFGDALAGRSDLMRRLAREGLALGGEGVDTGFAPDIRLADGETVQDDGWALRAIHTPGHFGNHLCLAWEDRIFTGDHVMGWASSMIAPPDGDMRDYMAGLARLQTEPARVLHPGHGAPILDPAARLAALVAHRRGREAAVLAALEPGGSDATALARRLYTDVAPALLPAAARSTLAHLLDLSTRGIVAAKGPIGLDAVFALV